LSELVWWQWIHLLERLQIHYMEDGTIQIYSWNAEHNTGKFPDIVAATPRCVMDLLVVTFNWMNGSQVLPSCIFDEPSIRPLNLCYSRSLVPEHLEGSFFGLCTSPCKTKIRNFGLISAMQCAVYVLLIFFNP
jgi:hypothetical protein